MPEEIFETPQPTQPTEPKTTNWPKIILAAVLGFALLAGAAYAGYWYGTQQVQTVEEPTPVVSQPTPKPTPTPSPVVEDETKDWKIYTNEELGYQIKLPERTIVEEDVYETHPFTTRFGLGSSALLPDLFEISKGTERIWPNAKAGYQVGPYEAYGSLFTGKETEIILVEAYLEFQHNGSWYSVHAVYFGPFDEKETIPKHIDQILSTFKFL